MRPNSDDIITIYLHYYYIIISLTQNKKFLYFLRRNLTLSTLLLYIYRY